VNIGTYWCGAAAFLVRNLGNVRVGATFWVRTSRKQKTQASNLIIHRKRALVVAPAEASFSCLGTDNKI
jgi:hypothetical protein